MSTSYVICHLTTVSKLIPIIRLSTRAIGALADDMIHLLKFGNVTDTFLTNRGEEIQSWATFRPQEAILVNRFSKTSPH